MSTIYDYLLDDSNDHDDGTVVPNIDYDKLWEEQPTVSFASYDDYIVNVHLSSQSPSEIRSDLEFYGIQIDPEQGAHAAVSRLHELGYDAEFGDTGNIPCAVYRANKGGSWVIYDRDWSGEWRTMRLRQFAKRYGHPFVH